MQGLIREASNLGDQDHDSSSGKNKLQKLEDALRETGRQGSHGTQCTQIILGLHRSVD